MIPVPDPLIVLDTTVYPFRWSTPDVKLTPVRAPYRAHTSTLVGNHMIVAFGRRIFFKLYDDDQS